MRHAISIEILQIESTRQPETCQLGWERVIRRVRLSLSNAVRVDKDRKNLPSSLSFDPTEFPDWLCHLQSGLWLVDSICNISMAISRNVFTRLSSCWLLLISINAAWTFRTALQFWRRGQILDRCMIILKTRAVVLGRNPLVTKKMGKSQSYNDG